MYLSNLRNVLVCDVWDVILLSVKTHQRVATGNTKSREVARALAGTAPSSTALNPGTRRGFLRRACHLTYT